LESISIYYNKLAATYDENRFANSYGKFIHQQEISYLNETINQTNTNQTLDLACGTGRLLEFAKYGVDNSPNMIDVAKAKYPNHNLQVGKGESLPFEDSFLKQVYSFHLFMHLEVNHFSQILNDVLRTLEKGGTFTFDFPSKTRRKITRYKATSWHGGTQISTSDIREIIKDNWEFVNCRGIAFFPIHRFPTKLRKHLLRLDNFLCKSVFKQFSSHLIFTLRKK
jgi:ubiquinone/menaquinone biosynthesis C-methylase UbiE